MKCPNCNETLLMTERQGIEIDYCPSCRGVWLDKGELDKLLQNAEQQAPSMGTDPNYKPYSDDRDDYYRHQQKHYKPHHKKKGFLGDLFDF
jgi:uncharacterized protein